MRLRASDVPHRTTNMTIRAGRVRISILAIHGRAMPTDNGLVSIRQETNLRRSVGIKKRSGDHRET